MNSVLRMAMERVSTNSWFSVQKIQKLEKEMASHSRGLAWRIPWVAESRTQLK